MSLLEDIRDDFSAVLADQDEFGEAATLDYKDISDNPQTLDFSGVFDRIFVTLDTEGNKISTRRPWLLASEDTVKAAVPAITTAQIEEYDPGEDAWLLTVRGTQFLVESIEPDGQGFVIIKLKDNVA